MRWAVTQIILYCCRKKANLPVRIREFSAIFAWNRPASSAIILGMKSPLNRGGLRFYLVIIALLAGTLLARTTSPRSILAGLPCLILGVMAAHLGQGLSAAEPGRRHDRAVSLRAAPVLPGQRPDRRRAGGDGRLVAAGRGLPVWWLAIYLPVIRGEERYLAENFPDEYPQYKRRVPCLIPWRRPLPYHGRWFSLEQPQHCRRGRASPGGADPGLSAPVLRGPRSPREGLASGSTAVGT